MLEFYQDQIKTVPSPSPALSMLTLFSDVDANTQLLAPGDAEPMTAGCGDQDGGTELSQNDGIKTSSGQAAADALLADSRITGGVQVQATVSKQSLPGALAPVTETLANNASSASSKIALFPNLILQDFNIRADSTGSADESQTGQEPLEPRTSKIASEDNLQIVFAAGGPTVFLETGFGEIKSKRMQSIRYANDATCKFKYAGDAIESLEINDAAGRLILKVVRDEATLQLKLEVATAGGIGHQLLKKAPTFSRDGILTIQSDQNGKVLVDASGRVMISSNSKASTADERLIVIDPNKQQDVYVNNNLVKRTFLDSPYEKEVFVLRDQGKPDEIKQITFKVGKTLSQFTKGEDGNWTALVLGKGNSQPVVGILELDEKMVPRFKSGDRLITIDEQMLLSETPGPSDLLKNQAKLQKHFIAVFELESEQRFLADIHREFKKSIWELPPEIRQAKLAAFKKHLQEETASLERDLAVEQKLLRDKVTELQRLNRREESLTEQELKQIWDRMPFTRRSYERLATWMEKSQVPTALNTIEQWKLAIPAGGPLSAPKDPYGNHIPVIGLNHALKKDVRLNLNFDKFPTPETLQKVSTINDWCSEIALQHHNLTIERDLKTVIPMMMARGEYPAKWMDQKGVSSEAQRNALLKMISICDVIREYGGAMLLSKKYRNPNLKYPPGATEGIDADGRPCVNFRWPDSISMSDPETIKLLQAYKHWIATEGKAFDDEQERLAKQTSNILLQGYYGDIPYKGFAVIESSGPNKGKLLDVTDSGGDGREPINLLSGDFSVEKSGDGYKFITEWQAKRANMFNYHNLGATRIGAPKVTESIVPAGAMVPVISHGLKLRVVPVEEAERMKTYQQILYVTEIMVDGVVDLSMAASGFGAGTLALYAGKQGLKDAAICFGRGALGASGLLLHNAHVMTQDWGPAALGVRSGLILTDVGHNFYRSFRPAAVPAYKSVALANLASSEWRFTKAIRGPLLKLDRLPQDSTIYKAVTGTSEVAFVGLLGKEFYHKYLKSKEKEASLPSSDSRPNLPTLNAPRLYESILGKPNTQTEEIRQRLALLEAVFLHVGGLKPLDAGKSETASKELELGLFKPIADSIDSKLAKMHIACQYMDGLCGSGRSDAEIKHVRAMQKKVKDLFFAQAPAGMDENQSKQWLAQHQQDRTRLISNLAKVLAADEATPVEKFSAVMALYAVSAGPQEIQRGLEQDNSDAGRLLPKFDSWRKADPLSVINSCASGKDATLRFYAAEMQLRLELEDRGPFYLATTMRELIKNPDAEESVKISAIENVVRLIDGLSRFEHNALSEVESGQRVDYIAQSSGNSPADLRLFLAQTAADKSVSDNVRVMAALGLKWLGSGKEGSLNREIALALKEYREFPAEFASTNIQALNSECKDSGKTAERLAALVALFDLGSLGGMETPEKRSKALLDVISSSSRKIMSGKDLSADDILQAAEAVARFMPEDIAALDDNGKKFLLKLLELPEYAGVDLIKINLLRKCSMFGDKHKPELEAAIVKLIEPSLGATLGINPNRSPSPSVRSEAIKALKEANIVSERSLSVLKAITRPPDRHRKDALDNSPIVRFEALSALAVLDHYSFKLAADLCLESETDPAIRTLAESLRLAQAFPVRDEVYRQRVMTAQERLRGTEAANWEKLGPPVLDDVFAKYNAIPKTHVVDVLVAKRVPTKTMTLTGDPVYETVYETEKQTVPNPMRDKFLQDNLFMKVVSQNAAERESAEQAVFMLLSQIAENKNITWVTDAATKLRLKTKATDVIVSILDGNANNIVDVKTVDRVKLIINDADTEPRVRWELLQALERYVARNGAKNPLLLTEHADYLAELLYLDAGQIEYTGSKPTERQAVQIEIIKQMQKYRTRAVIESLDIFAMGMDPSNPAVKVAKDTLYQLRDSVSHRYANTEPSKLTDKNLLADRMLKSFGTADSCQDIVDSLFQCSRGIPLTAGDPRLSSIRLALGATGADVKFKARIFAPAGGNLAPQVKESKMNGAEMIRLAAATIALERANIGVKPQDRLEAYKVCLQLFFEGKEEGYKKDAETLLQRGLYETMDPMSVLALADIVLEGRKKGELSPLETSVRDLLHKIMPEGTVEVKVPDGREVKLVRHNHRLTIEESIGGRLLRATTESTRTDRPVKSYTDTIFETMVFGYIERDERFAHAKLLLSSEAKGFLQPTPEHRRRSVEVLARLAEADDTNPSASIESRLAAAKYLKETLFPTGDFRQMTDVSFMDKASLEAAKDKLIVALTDLAVDGSKEAKDTLLAIARHDRETVLKLALTAIPNARRITTEAADERARQICFHLDCWELDPKDTMFGFDIARRGRVKSSDPGSQAPGTAAVERSLNALPKDSSGGIRLSGDVFREVVEAIPPRELKQAVIIQPARSEVIRKLSFPYKQLDKTKVEPWVNLMVDIATQGNQQPSSDEYAILAGVYLEAATALGMNAPCLKRVPFDAIVTRLSKEDGSELKLRLQEPYQDNNQIRLTPTGALRQASARVLGSGDPALIQLQKKLADALKKPAEIERFHLYFDSHGKDYLDTYPQSFEDAYARMTTSLVNVDRDTMISGKDGNWAPVNMLLIAHAMQKRSVAIEQFLEIAPPDVQLSVARGLLESRQPWVEEIAFTACARALRDGDNNVRKQVDEFLTKVALDQSGDVLERKQRLQRAFGKIENFGQTNDVFDKWKKQSKDEGSDAELQKLFESVKGNPQQLKELRTLLLNAPTDEKTRVESISLFVSTIKNDPKQVELLVDDILTLIKAVDQQKRIIKGFRGRIDNDVALLEATLKVLKARNAHTDVQKDLEDRIAVLRR